MKIKDVGEFGLIKRLAAYFNQNLSSGIHGIGDDCAVIPYQDSQSFLITTDLLVENIHFLKGKITPRDLGYKSLAVNLSDIAAMGGKPLYAFLSLGLPIDTEIEWMDQFFTGFKQLAAETSVSLLGGDTTRSESVVINVLLIGTIETALIKKRSQAIPGDFICCTGYLGDSGAGLKVLVEELPSNDHIEVLVQAHVCPRAHLKEGAWLAQHPCVHAMMDVSDGLASDIQRIMEESHCGARIEVERLPLSPHLIQASATFGWPSQELALTSGEDYCLLVTVDPQHYSQLNEAYQACFQRPLYHIGIILDSPKLIYTNHQQPYTPSQGGYDHFL